MSIGLAALTNNAPIKRIEQKKIVNRSLKAAINEIQKTKELNEENKQDSLEIPKIKGDVEQIQKLYDMFNRKLQFRINKDTNRVIIKVIDVKTDTVIREIPSEEIQNLQARIKKTVGLLFDEAI